MHNKTEDKKNHFVQFLKNEHFIEWKLLPTDELNAFWTEYLRLHPEEKEDLQLADEHFRRIKLSSFKLSQDKKDKAVKRLEQSLRKHNQRSKTRAFIYLTAAVAAVIFAILFYFKPYEKTTEAPIASANYILGSQLDSTEILFISDAKTSSFEENIDIQINHETANIKSKADKGRDIDLSEQAMNTLVVPYGKRSKLVLSDGTRIWMNSGSILTFPTQFPKDSREIKLAGEIYIEVAPDKSRPFYVNAPDFNVQVYGTKFNVNSYPGSSPEVVLVEGHIGLQVPGKKEIHLSPNERAVYTGDGIFNASKVDVLPFISWKDGYMTLDDTPLSEVLKQIERYYNLSFNYDKDLSLKELTCTGKIIFSDKLENVLTALSLISSTKYKIEDKRIYIYK